MSEAQSVPALSPQSQPTQPPRPAPPPPTINVPQAIGAIVRGMALARAQATPGPSPVPQGAPPNPPAPPSSTVPAGGLTPAQQLARYLQRNPSLRSDYGPDGQLIQPPSPTLGPDAQPPRMRAWMDPTSPTGRRFSVGVGPQSSPFYGPGDPARAINQNRPSTGAGDRLVIGAESGWNGQAVNPDMTSSGHAQGYFQITTGTWQDFAPKAGVNLEQYPDALHAPFDVQQRVAQIIPMARWTAGGFRAVKAQYPWATSDMTLGEVNQLASGNQRLVQPEPREPAMWGRLGDGFGSRIPGMMPNMRDTPGIMQGPALALLQIASASMHAPTWMMLGAFGAYMRARNQRQVIDQKTQQTKWQTALKEATAQQTLESQMAGDAFAALGNDPDSLTRALGSLATRFGDQSLMAALQEGGVDAAHKLLQQRDQYNVPLQKLRYQMELHQAQQAKAQASEEQQAAITDAVSADDVKWEQEHPDATDGEKAQAHLDHLAARTQEMKAKPVVQKPLTPGQQATADQTKAINNAVSADDADWARANPDATPGQTAQAHLDHLAKRTQELKARPSTAGSNLEVSKTMQVVDQNGNVIRTIMARERRDQAGWLDSQTGQPIQLKPGESLRQVTPGSATGGRAGAQVLRQEIGAREVLSDLQNAVRLPVGTTTGLLGNVVPGTSIVGAVTGDLGRTLTGQDAQFMQASMASLSRELSILMSPVYGGNYAAQQIEPLVPKAGDTLGTVIFKLARLAQSADNALEATSKSPILSNDERAYALDLRTQIQQAIPWTTSQAMDFAYRGQPHETFSDFVKRAGIAGPPAPAIGTVEGGFRYNGGDPGNPASWSKVP